MTRAAVLRQAGEPLRIEQVELAPTGADQVRVRIAASGVCHSDLALATGKLPYPTPAVLGHEGAGVVVEVGAAVTSVAPGDHVILAWNQPCRACFFCQRGEAHLCSQAMADAFAAPYGTAGGDAVFPMQGAGTFGEETLVLERSVVPVAEDVPFEVAALIGCGVTTGVGAVLNTARVTAGSQVAIIGCGGVGLSAIQGARVAGATRIFAIDVVAEKLALAQAVGATDVVDASAGDPVQAVLGETEWRGVDYAFEVVGRSETIRQAFDLTRRGGTTVVVGAGRMEDAVAFNALELSFMARNLVGCVYGSADPARDFPRFVELWRDGQLDLERLISQRITLDEIDGAFERLERGDGARSVIVFDEA